MSFCRIVVIGSTNKKHFFSQIYRSSTFKSPTYKKFSYKRTRKQVCKNHMSMNGINEVLCCAVRRGEVRDVIGHSLLTNLERTTSWISLTSSLVNDRSIDR